MNSFNKTWNKSYSETDLMTSFSETHSSIMRSPIIIRRMVCMEEVVPSFVPIETAYYNKISSPHRRKNYQHHKASTNLNKSKVSEEIEFQISNLNLSNNHFSNSFSSFSYCSPQFKVLPFKDFDSNDKCNIAEPKLINCETQPMEVDSFKDSKNNSKVEECDFKMDLHIRENTTSPIIPQENALRLRNLKVKPSQNNEVCDNAMTKQKSFQKLSSCLIVALIVVASLCFFSDNIFDLDFKEFNLENLEKDLTAVYKQDQVIDTIINNLKNRETWQGNKKLLAFFGSSGVGKTFVTNILKENIPRKCVHEIDGRYFENNKVTDMALINLKSRKLNFIIIDDIKNTSSTNLVNFIKLLDPQKEVLIIAIFSTVQVDEDLEKHLNYEYIDGIKNEFLLFGLNHEIVLFTHFSDNDIKCWIKTQLFLRKIPSKYHDAIIKNLLKDYDIKLNGLKGLHSKMVLEVEKFV